MNLADALLLPQDDLALAVALKSPLFGLTDDDLYKLAWQRKGSLRAALRLHAAADRKFDDAFRRLEICERRYETETPFAFYAWLLGGDGGRARILKRLGQEANDALDEFLELALGYERKAAASLQGFMAWLRTADLEVKRDMEISRDEVRVMTVHGAKGLEASVVFLVDTTSSPSDTQRLKLIHLSRANVAPHAPAVVVWAGKKADDPAAVAAARTAMLGETEDEYRRLLYVAMTRAADRLIVGGCMPGNMNTVRKHSWYDLIVKGLGNSGLHEQIIETADGPVKRYSRPEDVARATGAAVALNTAAPAELPPWLRVSIPAETSAVNLLRPSDRTEDDGHRTRTGESAADTRTRLAARNAGTPAAAIIARCRNRATPRRGAAIPRPQCRRLDRRRPRSAGGKGAGPDRRCPLRIGFPRPAAAPRSRSLDDWIGRDSTPALVSGQIDRLVAMPDEVLIVDYKTNHAPPTLRGRGALRPISVSWRSTARY